MPTRYLLLLCLGGFLLPSLHAQDVLQGRVTDAETSRPLEAVMVSVLRDSMTIDYTLTDADGTFALDTHLFRVGNRTRLAPGKTPLAVEEKLDFDTAKLLITEYKKLKGGT